MIPERRPRSAETIELGAADMSQHNGLSLIGLALAGAAIGASIGVITALRILDMPREPAPVSVPMASQPQLSPRSDAAVAYRISAIEARLEGVDDLRREQRHLSAKVGQLLASFEALRAAAATPSELSPALEHGIVELVERLLSQHPATGALGDSDFGEPVYAIDRQTPPR
jgi:hypothetical protein